MKPPWRERFFFMPDRDTFKWIDRGYDDAANLRGYDDASNLLEEINYISGLVRRTLAIVRTGKVNTTEPYKTKMPTTINMSSYMHIPHVLNYVIAIYTPGMCRVDYFSPRLIRFRPLQYTDLTEGPERVLREVDYRIIDLIAKREIDPTYKNYVFRLKEWDCTDFGGRRDKQTVPRELVFEAC